MRLQSRLAGSGVWLQMCPAPERLLELGWSMGLLLVEKCRWLLSLKVTSAMNSIVKGTICSKFIN